MTPYNRESKDTPAKATTNQPAPDVLKLIQERHGEFEAIHQMMEKNGVKEPEAVTEVGKYGPARGGQDRNQEGRGR